MNKISISIFILFVSVFHCLAQKNNEYKNYYRAVLTTPGGELPFQLSLSEVTNARSGEIYNGEEEIPIQVLRIDTDSIQILSTVFNTEIRAKFSENTEQLSGYWYDHSRPGNYYLPFNAVQANNVLPYRFLENPKPPKSDISGKYDAIFKDKSSTDSAIGVFKQYGNLLSGTFLTTTGDYRFLEGEVSVDSFFLSTFDGSHAYLFKGKIHDDGTLTCNYWSGKHYHATIKMKRNENAHLPDASKLTYLKEGYSTVDFSFPDENGEMISMKDEQFKNKPVVILISGSWCPNCMDEASFMSEIEETYKSSDLKIISLQFERQTDSVNFKKNISKLRSHFGIEYPMLNAGPTKNASSALPMLNQVLGFPTTIILNRSHNVVHIYTGFSGPATGDLFVEYQKEFHAIMKEILTN